MIPQQKPKRKQNIANPTATQQRQTPAQHGSRRSRRRERRLETRETFSSERGACEARGVIASGPRVVSAGRGY